LGVELFYSVSHLVEKVSFARGAGAN
jgi:hypothetical protein